MARGSSLLRRFSSREKRIAGVAAILLFVLAGGAIYAYLGMQISEMEEVIAEGSAALEEIRVSSQEYLDSMRRKRALEDAIKKNDPKIQTAIDSLAKRLPVMRPDAPLGEDATFDKVLRYEAKTTERPVYLGDAGKKKSKRDKASDFIELSQPLEYSFVKFVDLVGFLEEVESPERLMYVSKLVMTKKYMDPDYIQGKMTIATFIYKPQAKEEEEEE